MKECVKDCEYFKNNVPQCQIKSFANLIIYTHNIIKRFENWEISVCKDKAKDHCLMPWSSGPQTTASLIGMILSLTLLNGPRNTSKPLSVNTIRRAICRCQLKLYHAKGSLMWTWSWSTVVSCGTVSKWKVFYGQTSPIWHSCWKSRTPCLRAKEEGDLPAFHQRSAQKPASLMYGVHNCITVWAVHVLEGTMNAESYIKVLEQHMLPSRWRVFHFIVEDWVLNWLPAVQIFYI